MKKENQLTKDDKYEIEKVLDDQAAKLIQSLNELCKNATYEEGLSKKESNLNQAIRDVKSGYEKLKTIRDKLENQRKQE